ncbi:MAG TPA: hypothetical protein VFS29_08835 [Motilibacteraceae bacterium]|nr:hypothetical protein [Motilibacteraceae bacterium]
MASGPRRVASWTGPGWRACLLGAARLCLPAGRLASGRLDLRRRRIALGLLGVGTAGAVVAHLSSSLLLRAAGGTGALERSPLVVPGRWRRWPPGWTASVATSSGPRPGPAPEEVPATVPGQAARPDDDVVPAGS